MNAHARTFEAKDAVRHDTPLLIGLEGPPGGGKTWSALLLADGMKQVRGGDIVVIDTEGKRALAYADFFKFRHVDFQPPFKSPDFLAAVQQQLSSNPAAVIIDSASDEHEGEGGYLDWHEEEVDRMLGQDRDNWSRRDAMNQAGWIRPKRARIKMMNSFLRINTPLIFCFRAREKTKPMKQQKNGREVTVPVNIGYQPICPGEIAHAMTMMCLLPPRSDGVPQWKSDSTTQDFVIKLPEQFKPLFATPGPITRDHGRALAEWAKGGTASQPNREMRTAAEISTAPVGADNSDSRAVETNSDWQEYVDRWNAILQDATDSRELSALWNGDTHKEARRNIEWPPGALQSLMTRVGDKIAALKGATASA